MRESRRPTVPGAQAGSRLGEGESRRTVRFSCLTFVFSVSRYLQSEYTLNTLLPRIISRASALPPSRAPLLGASPRHLLTYYLLTSPRATLLDEFRVCPLVSLVSVRFVQGKCAAAVSVFTPSSAPFWPAQVVRWNCPPDRSLDCVGGPAECLRASSLDGG